MNVSTTPDIERALAAGALVVVGVSGGKDSQACALAVAAYLAAVGHKGRLRLIHSDLGFVEWSASLPTCERLADHLGVELITVRRPAGGLMERWEARWESSVRRYNALETMTLVLPWSTPRMRFCTSELKTDVINAELRRRALASGVTEVVSTCGIRREESPARRLKPVASLAGKGSSRRIALWNWHPIIEWPIAEVFSTIANSGLALHEAYTTHGLTRVSCAFCIYSSVSDLRAAAGAAENAALYRRMVALESRSTFGFQGARWLADVAPTLLDPVEASAVARAKEGAQHRIEAEAEIPRDLLHDEKGWPRRMPTPAEADLIAGIRRRVAWAAGLGAIGYLDGGAVYGRFAELISRPRKERPQPEEHAHA